MIYSSSVKSFALTSTIRNTQTVIADPCLRRDRLDRAIQNVCLDLDTPRTRQGQPGQAYLPYFSRGMTVFVLFDLAFLSDRNLGTLCSSPLIPGINIFLPPVLTDYSGALHSSSVSQSRTYSNNFINVFCRFFIKVLTIP